MKKLYLIWMLLVVLGVMSGCDNATEKQTKDVSDVLLLRRNMNAAYLEELKNVAIGNGYECGESWNYNARFDILYVDDKYLSFRQDAWVDSECYAHGATSYIVGTIDRKSGQVLKAADLIPEQKREEVKEAIRDGVYRKIGENMLKDPELTDNCCVVEYGILFVYNEYEIAPFSYGPIEVGVNLSEDRSLPTITLRVKTNSIYCEPDEGYKNLADKFPRKYYQKGRANYISDDGKIIVIGPGESRKINGKYLSPIVVMSNQGGEFQEPNIFLCELTDSGSCGNSKYETLDRRIALENYSICYSSHLEEVPIYLSMECLGLTLRIHLNGIVFQED